MTQYGIRIDMTKTAKNRRIEVRRSRYGYAIYLEGEDSDGPHIYITEEQNMRLREALYQATVQRGA